METGTFILTLMYNEKSIDGEKLNGKIFSHTFTNIPLKKMEEIGQINFERECVQSVGLFQVLKDQTFNIHYVSKNVIQV